jgi:hypothetical protein
MTEKQFDEVRPSAFAIAYRMLGGVSEAEDLGAGAVAALARSAPLGAGAARDLRRRMAAGATLRRTNPRPGFMGRHREVWSAGDEREG